MAKKRFVVFSLTNIGESHLVFGRPCQDFSAHLSLNGARAFCVSDGHGGADYFRSDRGSRFACEAFMECFRRNHGPGGSLRSRSALRAMNPGALRAMSKFILSLWREKVAGDALADPFHADELDCISHQARRLILSEGQSHLAYGATLAGTVMLDDWWYAIQIGDGEIARIGEDVTVSRPLGEDELCVGNLTTSLCDENAANEFRHCFLKEKPNALFAVTDGIDKSFGIEGADELDKLYLRMREQFVLEGERKAASELAAFLPVLSKKGSRDDVSVAGAIRLPEGAEGGLARVLKSKIPIRKR